MHRVDCSTWTTKVARKDGMVPISEFLNKPLTVHKFGPLEMFNSTSPLSVCCGDGQRLRLGASA